MKKQKHFILVSISIIIWNWFLMPLESEQKKSEFYAQNALSFNERVTCQVAIEKVFWKHRIWPEQNIGAKPEFELVISNNDIEIKVNEILLKSQALSYYWHRPITGQQLQAEIDRMARSTRQPKVLKELWQALDNNAFLIAECLARPLLADRLIRSWYRPNLGIMENFIGSDGSKNQPSFDEWWVNAKKQLNADIGIPVYNYRLPEIEVVDCQDDSWMPTLAPPMPREYHVAVWTGSEMIIWGGWNNGTSWFDNVGYRYNPATDSWVATSTVNAPEKRINTTAVWTGTEMIVWGGQTFYGDPNIGGRYDPVTDTWTPVSTINEPEPRYCHTAVWTGEEMIIFGGAIEGDVVNTGGRYNPVSDSWVPTSLINAPAVCYHTAVWTGTEMIIWQGDNGIDSGRRYNPENDTWTTISTINAPQASMLYTAVWAKNEMIVWGGLKGTLLNTGARYNPATDSWTEMSVINAPEKRGDHTAIWTGTEMIIWGGYTLGSIGAEVIYLNSGGKYNPKTDSWTATSLVNAPTPRRFHTMVWTGTEAIIWGGFDSATLNSGGRYDPVSDSWVATGPFVPRGRYDHTAIWTGSEMIIWGGHSSYMHNSGGKYVPATDSWTATSTIGAPSPRIDPSVVWTGTEMIIWGGTANGGESDTGGRYNPVLDSWTPTSVNNAPAARESHTAVWTGTEMIVWGGGGSGYYNTGGRYNPATDSWIATSTLNAPEARYQHTSVWTGSEMIVWGGRNILDYFNTGGKYNPISDSWTPTNITLAPSARSEHTAVWSGTEMIIWGGHNNSAIFNTGGKYNPSSDSWIPTSTINVPEPLFGHTVVWTGIEKIVWGGLSNGTDTGGRYNALNDSWQLTTLVNVPSARRDHSAVWTGNEMIIWGGYKDVPLDTGGKYCVDYNLAPGTVPDNDNFAGTPLTISKPGSQLLLNWGKPGGTCQTDDYAIYRGMLPFVNYNHSLLLCTTGGLTSAQINADTNNYYYIIVAQDGQKEGSYGLDSSNAQRPPASIPCFPQEIGTCN